jgi:FixJ family two-component response regulator
MTTAAQVALLLTDLVLPGGLTGQELAVRLGASKPELCVAFLSGCNLDVLEPGFRSSLGRFDPAKPFASRRLVQFVRECLDQRALAKESSEGQAPAKGI